MTTIKMFKTVNDLAGDLGQALVDSTALVDERQHVQASENLRRGAGIARAIGLQLDEMAAHCDRYSD